MVELREGEFGVVHLLVLVLDGLGVDALAGGGVVLDLDGEVAADALDEDAFRDGDVRMVAVAVGLAVGRLPAEIVRGRIADAAVFGLRAAVEVAEVAVVEGPLEDGVVVERRAGAELGVEVPADDGELPERRLLIDVVEALEVGDELPVLERLQRLLLEPARGLVAPVDGEDVRQVHLLLEAEADVEGEEKPPVAERHHVARDAVVRGGDAVGLEQLGFDPPEDLLPPGVEPAHALAQGGRVRRQPLPDDLVGGAAEGGGRRGGRRRCSGSLGWGFGFSHESGE